jgi:hypothetical protein
MGCQMLDDKDREELQRLMDKNTKQWLLSAVNLCKVTDKGFGKTRELLSVTGSAVATQLWFIPDSIVVENCHFSAGTKLSWHRHISKQFTIIYKGKADFFEKNDATGEIETVTLENMDTCCAMGKCIRYTEPMVEHSVFCPNETDAIIVYMPALPEMEVR